MKKAHLSWNREVPISKEYDEGYFSIHGGLEESLHVFLKGNNLPSAWENKKTFVIGESGFGTGLNFLNIFKMYEECENKPNDLYFISAEIAPLSLQDLKKAHSFFPSIQKYAKKLHEKYPLLNKGVHYLDFGNVKLMLCFGDIKDVFSNLNVKVNAWFLDGFSPSKNPDMWDNETLKIIKNLSSQNTTLATFSVARSLKNAIENVGFKWKKAQGYGMKKDMLKATIKNVQAKQTKPWFALPKANDKEKKAIILGAGIAGASIAYKLAKRGWEVDIIDKNDKPGMGGSGNHCGAVTPLITLPQISLGQMYERAFLQAVSFYKELGIGEFNGLKHYVYDKTYQKRWDAWDEIKSELIVCKEDKIGKYFEVVNGGYLQPFKACEDLVNAFENIHFYGNHEIIDITNEDKNYTIKTDKKLFKTNTLIIALGYESEKILSNHSWNLQKIRGQVTFLPNIVMTNEPLCAKGYVCPFIGGKQVIGATYIKDDECLSVRNEDNKLNLAHVKQFLNGAIFEPQKLDGRVSFRCSSSDRFPLIGAIGDVDFFKKEYKALPWKKHKPEFFKNASYLPNLYISSAHGSRGLVSGILGANIIEAMLEGLPVPLEENLLHELNPNRFTIRRLQRQEVW